MRLAIIGWPGTGKTTLGKQLADRTGIPYRSTDDIIAILEQENVPQKERWSETSKRIAGWLDAKHYIIEGVALPRAFRKWRENHPGESAPVDRVIYLTKVFRELAPGAVSMGKGVDTVLAEIRDWLPGVEVHETVELP